MKKMKEFEVGIGILILLMIFDKPALHATEQVVSPTTPQEVKVFSDEVVMGEELGITYWEAEKTLHKLGYSLFWDELYDSEGEHICDIETYNLRVRDGSLSLPTRFFADNLGLTTGEENGKLYISTEPTKIENYISNEYMFNLGESTEFDLDKDGKVDMINLEQTLNQYGEDCIYININGNQTFVEVMNPVPRYAIIQLEEDTPLLAIQSKGLSDDYITYFFRYESEGKGTYKVGELEGLIEGGMALKEGMLFAEKGNTVTTERRLNVLHTGWYLCDAKINKDNIELLEPQDGFYSTYWEVKTEEDWLFYEKPDVNSGAIKVDAGTKLTITATDNKDWVKLQDGSGREYFLKMNMLDGMCYTEEVVECGTGRTLQASELFSGLFYAD